MDIKTAIQILEADSQQITSTVLNSIKNRHEQFHDLLCAKYYNWRHESSCGYFISEYVINLKNVSTQDDVDTIFICARRLLEVFITLKYISKTNNFDKILDYCESDRYEYLSGCEARVIADEKLFPDLKGINPFGLGYKQEKESILKRYKGKLNKMPNIKKMAEEIGYKEEYNYFYKFTSKILHFCPFSLNGDARFEDKIHKVVFLRRISKYLEEINKELENIYQAIPKAN